MAKMAGFMLDRTLSDFLDRNLWSKKLQEFFYSEANNLGNLYNLTLCLKQQFLAPFFTHLFPAQRPTRLILSHSGLKEILLFFQIYHLGHPGEWIACIRIKFVQANLLAAACSV